MAVENLRRKIIVNFFFQLLAKLLVPLVYRIRVEGSIDAPKGKGVLLIANHTSFIDFVIISIIVPLKKTMFGIMDYGVYNVPAVNAIVRHTATIPIASKKVSLEVREKAFAEIHELLSQGQLVLFFPEGVVSYDGKMSPFQYGLERIRTENPEAFVVPITINGLLGGFFSRLGGLFEKSKFAHEWRRDIHVKVSPPIPAHRWKIDHFETKVKLMLKSMGQDNEQIDCIAPLQLPAVRNDKRIPFPGHLKRKHRSVFLKTRESLKEESLKLVLVDYSPGGFCVEVEKPLAADTVLELAFENASVENLECRVCWCRPTENNSYLLGLGLAAKHVGRHFFEVEDDKAS